MGAGKTTLVHALARQLGSLALPERDDENPYLRRFYADPPRWAFKSYAFFVNQTLEDHRRASSSPRGAVQERVLEEHAVVFGEEFHRRGYLDDPDWEVLSSLTFALAGSVPAPDLLIHLEIEPAEALRRLHHRATAIEDGIRLDYLQSLNARYGGFVDAWSGRVVRLDSNTRDFREERDVADLATDIGSLLAQAEVT